MISDADRLPFLRAIIAAPDDDLPRLVMADFLEENGDAARAEFIRCQVEEAAIPFALCDSIYPGCTVSGGKVFSHDHKCRGFALRKRANELFDFFDECPVKRIKYSRGFISEVELRLDQFMGGECEFCIGGSVAVVASTAGLTSCSGCSGTGQRPGLGRQIAAREPVEVWKLSDREPVNDDDGRHCWETADDPYFENGNRYELPPSLFSLLYLFVTPDVTLHDNDDGTRWFVYPTREAAVEALSEACWLYANRPRIEAEAMIGPVQYEGRNYFRVRYSEVEAADRAAYFQAYARKRAEARSAGNDTPTAVPPTSRQA